MNEDNLKGILEKVYWHDRVIAASQKRQDGCID